MPLTQDPFAELEAINIALDGLSGSANEQRIDALGLKSRMRSVDLDVERLVRTLTVTNQRLAAIYDHSPTVPRGTWRDRLVNLLLVAVLKVARPEYRAWVTLGMYHAIDKAKEQINVNEDTRERDVEEDDP